MKHVGVKRNQKVSKNPSQNTGNSVYGGLPGQTFYGCHEDKGKKKVTKVTKVTKVDFLCVL